MTEYVKVTYEDYTALYADGELVQFNDNYIVDDYIFEKLLGGKVESSDAFYEKAASDDWDYMAPETLEEYHQWQKELEDD